MTSSPPAAPPIPKADSIESLRELQRLLFCRITRPPEPADRTEARSEGNESLAALASRLIRPSASQAPLDRLEIYHRQYWLRLWDAFSEDLPCLESLLGPERFRSLIAAYLLRYPPTSPLLRTVAIRIPRFLREEPDWAAPYPHRLVLDLARFECAKIAAFYAPEWPVPRTEELATAEIRLFLQPHLVLLTLRYPVERWKRKTGDSPPSPEPSRVVVHRQRQTVYHKRLSREAFFLLRSFKSGLTVRQACERTAEKHPGLPPERYREWFQEWSSLGWFSARSSSLDRSLRSETS
ncbi:MAG: putative DNA-binding domain-containing protein [Candidatus Methylacidiphilaceae bacterium]